jgi:ribonuclease-3
MLSIAISQELYISFPNKQEGDLTSFRSALVRWETLAQVAKTLCLGDYLILGSGEEASGGRERKSNLAAVFEALVGAILLDKGQKIATGFILKCLGSEIRRLAREGVPTDPKSHLQEKSQSLGKGTPTYRTIKISEEKFKAEVVISNEIKGTGEGKRKLDAERTAAIQALDSMQSNQ